MSHAIWQIGLFKQTTDNLVECSECKDKNLNATLKLSNKSIKGLKVHLFAKHKESPYAKKYFEIEEGKSSQSDQKITNYTTRSSGKLSALDKDIINFIACCNVPFQIVNNKTFKKLLRSSSENLLDESHYRKEVLPEVFNVVKDKIKSQIADLEHISFTSDIWTSDTTKDAFISLTANGVTAKFSRKKFTLSIKKFHGSHTAERTCEILTKLLEDWGAKKCHCFITDSASNLVKALDLMQIERMSCAAHDLNLCVKSCFSKEKDDLVQIFEKCRKIISTLKHSSNYERVKLEPSMWINNDKAIRNLFIEPPNIA